jgi:uncharacterized membrane protein YbhN (UPF0104 family)
VSTQALTFADHHHASERGPAPIRRAVSALAGSRRRAAAWGLLAALAVGAALWAEPLGDVTGRLGAMNPVWLVVALGLELAACVSYVVVFRRLFDQTRGRSTGKVAWIGLAAGAVLPGGDVSGAAASSALLHRDGVPKRQLVERASALLLLINAVSLAAAGVAGALLLSGAATGPHDLLRAGLPVIVAMIITGTVAVIPFAVRRAGERAPSLVVTLAGGVSGAGRSLRRPSWRLLGAVGYPILDMGALWAVCTATGHTPSFAALIVAYNVGYLASIVPIPAGVGVVDGGLAAALILYGVPATTAVVAVLVHHALSVWVPALGGLGAWLLLRRERAGRTAAGTAASRSPHAPRLVGQLA